jgi:hypothetical protein
VQQEAGEQQRAPSGADRDRASVVDDLERSEDAVVRLASLPGTASPERADAPS